LPEKAAEEIPDLFSDIGKLSERAFIKTGIIIIPES
jgi:hypothetical protein